MGGVGQTVGAAALPPQIAQHQAANQRCGGGQQQNHESSNHNGEENLFLFGNGAELLHLNAALFLGGEQAHNGWLNHGNQRHVGVGCNGDGTQQMGSQFRGQIQRRGAVSAAYDTDGRGLRTGKAQNNCQQECGIHAQLRSGAQQQTFGVCNQRAEVRHSAHTQENQRRVHTGFHADVQNIQQSAVMENGAVADFTGQKPIPQLRVIQIRSGEIGQQHAEGNANHEQRLVFLYNAQIQQHAGQYQHHCGLPAHLGETGVEPDGFQNICHRRTSQLSTTKGAPVSTAAPFAVTTWATVPS